MSDPCPVCKKKVLWFGEGERPKGPCPRCQMTLPRWATTKTERFWEFALEAGHVTVVRCRRIIGVLEEDGHVVDRPGWSLAWRVPGETPEGWRMITYTEELLLDDYGNLNDKGSMWRRVYARSLPVTFDTSRSGAF